MSSVASAAASKRQRFLFSDLDGTILPPRTTLPPAANLEALTALGNAGILRVIVTGRDSFSARPILESWGRTQIASGACPAGLTPLEAAPVDYLVFSSGAGTMHVSDWTVTDARNLGTL